MRKTTCGFMVLIVFMNLALFATPAAKVLVVYYSKTGATRQMAQAVVKGAGSVPGTQTKLLTVNRVKTADLLWADGIILGTPVYSCNIAPEMLEFINNWPFDGKMKDKVGAAFVTGGALSGGEELAQLNLLHAMLVYGMVVVGGTDGFSFFGASAITEEAPFLRKENKGKVHEPFLKKARQLGKRLALLVVKFSTN